MRKNEKFQPNKTSTYLLPILTLYGKEMLEMFAQLYILILKIGIYDVQYLNVKQPAFPCFFILLENKKQLRQVLKKLRFSEYYIDDYIYSHITNTQEHVLVLKVHEKFTKAYEAFIQGKFSEMYSAEEIALLNIQKDKTNKLYRVLTKDRTLLPEFQTALNAEFGTNVVIDDDRELDFVLKCNETI